MGEDVVYGVHEAGKIKNSFSKEFRASQSVFRVGYLVFV